jgi:hypothetical protein
MTKLFGGRLTMAKMGRNFEGSVVNAGDLIGANGPLSKDPRRQFLRRDDDSVIADGLRGGLGDSNPRRFSQSCLESGLLLEDEPRAMKTGQRTHGSGSSGGGLSRLIVAALVLVLAAATFAQARPYSFQWDANNDGVTTGYLVSYGLASGSYGSTADIDAGNVTAFQVDLLPGRTYYFIVKGYTAAHVPGPASAELSFFVPVNATLTVSSTSVSSGANVTTTAGSGTGNRLDRIALFAVGSNTELAWKYLNGTQSAPATGVTGATVPFTMPTAAGQYQFRFLDSAGGLLATSPTVTVAAPVVPPSITPAATSVTGGTNLQVTVAHGSGNRLDWVALYPLGSSTSLDWQYLNGSRTAPSTGVTGATLTFAMPTTGGQYVLRLFAANTSSFVATSATVTVTAVVTANPSVTVGATSVTSGSNLQVTVANGPGNRLDYVGVYPVGSSTSVTWKYLNGTQSAPATGVTGASLTFAMPTAGQFVLRLFSNNSSTFVANSATVTVTAVVTGSPTLTPAATSVAGGSSLAVTLANGPGNRLDWVAMYPVGSNVFVDWQYLNGTRTAPSTGVTGTALHFTMPTTSGQYILRFFSNNAAAFVANSPTVTVTGGGTGVPPPSGGSPSLTPAATSVTGGSSLAVTLANGPGNRLDWVAMYPVGSNVFVDWQYLNGTRTAPSTGVTGTTLHFTMPTTSGQYILRFFSNNSAAFVANSATVTVTGTVVSGSPSLTPAATSVAGGSNLPVTVANGPGNRLDWVAMYPVGSSVFVDWKYLNGTRTAPSTGVTATTLNFTMPASGQYILMFFSSNASNFVATTASITAQ